MCVAECESELYLPLIDLALSCFAAIAQLRWFDRRNQLQRSLEPANLLAVCRAMQRDSRSLLPVVDRLGDEPGFLEVIRDRFRMAR